MSTFCNGILYENDAIRGDAVERIIRTFYENKGYRVEIVSQTRAAAGRADVKVYLKDRDNRFFKCYEVKTSACNLYPDNGNSNFFFSGSSSVFYVPIVFDAQCINHEKTVTIKNPLELEGFYIPKKNDFLHALEETPLVLRHNKKSSAEYNGIENAARTTAIKTFFNSSKQEICSNRVYNALLEMLYQMVDNGKAQTLTDFLNQV